MVTPISCKGWIWIVTLCNVPNQRVQCLHSFPVHPRVVNLNDIIIIIAAGLRIIPKQTQSSHQEALIPSFQERDELCKGIGPGGLVVVVKVRRVRQEVVRVSLQLLEGGRDGKPRFFRHYTK